MSHSGWSEGGTASPVIFNACFRIAITKLLASQEGLISNGGRWRPVRADGFDISGGNVNRETSLRFDSLFFTNLMHKFFILTHL